LYIWKISAIFYFTLHVAFIFLFSILGSRKTDDAMTWWQVVLLTREPIHLIESAVKRGMETLGFRTVIVNCHIGIVASLAGEKIL
jgi:hypothetical protein